MRGSLCFSILLTCLACQSLPPCAPPHEIRLRWGIAEHTGIRGYELTTRGELFSYKAHGDSLLHRYRLGRVSPQLYCTLLTHAHRTFLTLHAFHVPADTQYFLEYRSPAAFIRMAWNPRSRTHATEPLWALYDSLEVARLCCVR